MSISATYAAANSGGTVVSSLTVTPSGGLVAGNYVVCSISSYVPWQITPQSTIVWETIILSGNSTASAYYGIAIGRVLSSTSSFTIGTQNTVTGSFACAYAIYTSSTGARLRVDMAAANNNSGTATTTPTSGATATTSSANQVWVSCVGTRNAVTFSSPINSFTIQASTSSTIGLSTDRSAALMDRFVSSPGTASGGCTISASNIWACSTITIEETPAGGGGSSSILRSPGMAGGILG